MEQFIFNLLKSKNASKKEKMDASISRETFIKSEAFLQVSVIAAPTSTPIEKNYKFTISEAKNAAVKHSSPKIVLMAFKNIDANN